MDQNTEYEKFTQEVYESLSHPTGLNTKEIKHNIKLTGKSGQSHQIDVYWVYELNEKEYKVAIECKNYNKNVPIGTVRDFFGVLYDLDNVAGIMVTKKGYQEGAKKYASYYGININELRTPNKGEAIIGEIEINIDCRRRSRLFLIDNEWAKENNIDYSRYLNSLDSLNSLSWPPQKAKISWTNATHIPLNTTPNTRVIDEKGYTIISFDKLESELTPDSDNTFYFDNAYVETNDGKIKIKEIKYAYQQTQQITIYSIDAHEFTKALIKDALSGEVKLIPKDIYIT